MALSWLARVARGLAVVAAVALAGCASADDEVGVEPPSQSAVEPSASTAGIDVALSDELVAMFERDQQQRTGVGDSGETDEERTARLAEILDEHGWPGFDLVGKEGEDAAWTIAQHSDLDPGFQAEALDLLRTAVAEGRASPGNLAYLEDRVAVGAGRPQL